MSEHWCRGGSCASILFLQPWSKSSLSGLNFRNEKAIVMCNKTASLIKDYETGRNDQLFLLFFTFTIAQPRMLCTIFSCIYPTLPYPTPYPPPYPTPYSMYLGCAQLHRVNYCNDDWKKIGKKFASYFNKKFSTYTPEINARHMLWAIVAIVFRPYTNEFAPYICNFHFTHQCEGISF